MSKPKLQKTVLFLAPFLKGLLIKGAGSVKVLPSTDDDLVEVVIELIHLVLLEVEHVRHHFLSSAPFACSGESILFLSGAEAVMFLFGTEADDWL